MVKKVILDMDVSVLLLWISLLISGTQGRSNLRIIGGKNVTDENLSYIIRLETYVQIDASKDMTVPVCTGSALTPTWTLTAEHCCPKFVMRGILSPNRSVVNTYIRYGSVLTPLSTHSKADVLSCITHKYGDVALLQTQPIHISQYARVSALDYQSLIGEELTIYGYGKTNCSKKIESTLDLNLPLQKLDVAVIKCDKTSVNYMYSVGDVAKPSICVSRRCGVSATACGGDSGGPAMHDSGIVGLSWYVMNSNTFIIPDKLRGHGVVVLTALSPYVDWIAANVKYEN